MGNTQSPGSSRTVIETNLKEHHIKSYLILALDRVSSRFANLPRELIEEIAPFLGLNDLLRLLRVCKSIAEGLLPALRKILYPKVAFAITCGDDYFRVGFFLRTLIRNPHIADMVESLAIRPGPDDFEACATEDDAKTLRAAIFSPEDNKLVLQPFRTAVDAGHFDKLLSSLTRCSPSALVTLILLQCKQLRALHIEPNIVYHSAALKTVLGYLPTTLPQLRTIHLSDPSGHWRSHRMYDAAPITTFLPLFYCEKLEDLSLTLPHVRGRWGTNEGFDLSWPRTQPLNLPGLRSLKFIRSRMPEVSLLSILPYCPNVETFVFNYEFICTYRRFLDCAVLVDALGSIKSSLKNLTISLHYASDEDEDVGNHSSEVLRGCLGTALTGFAKLVKLDVEAVVLLGWAYQDDARLDDVLPTSLETLTLRSRLNFLSGFEWTTGRVLRCVGGLLKERVLRPSRYGPRSIYLEDFFFDEDEEQNATDYVIQNRFEAVESGNKQAIELSEQRFSKMVQHFLDKEAQ